MISRLISLCRTIEDAEHREHVVHGRDGRGHAELELEPEGDVDDDPDDRDRDGPQRLLLERLADHRPDFLDADHFKGIVRKFLLEQGLDLVRGALRLPEPDQDLVSSFADLLDRRALEAALLESCSRLVDRPRAP